MRTISDDERRARLANRHRLVPSGRVDSVPEIADSLVALHSTDPATVYLSIAARSTGLIPADVERALYEARTVIRHHAMRRTLWVTTPEVAELVHAACTRKIAAVERTRSAEFVGDAAWFDDAVSQVVEYVRAADAPVATRSIGDALPELRREIVYGVGTRHEATGRAHTRAVLVAAFDGDLVRDRPSGTWVGTQYRWVHRSERPSVDWDRHDPVAGMTGVVGRWLDRFGPATLTDLVWWTGATKTLVRKALAALDIEPVELGNGEGYLLAGDGDEEDRLDESWIAVLPALDPTAMGWKERGWYLDEQTAARVVDRFGNIGPTIWADGRIVGGWAQRPDGEFAIEWTVDVSADHRAMVDDEVRRLTEFIGETRFRVRFPSPNQKQLLA